MFRRLFYTLVLATFLVSAVVTGCAPVTVRQTTLQHTYTDVRADVLTTGELSQMTQQVLRMRGVLTAAQEPAARFKTSRHGAPESQMTMSRLLWLNLPC
jgi:hypothetical protein